MLNLILLNPLSIAERKTLKMKVFTILSAVIFAAFAAAVPTNADKSQVDAAGAKAKEV